MHTFDSLPVAGYDFVDSTAIRVDSLLKQQSRLQKSLEAIQDAVVRLYAVAASSGKASDSLNGKIDELTSDTREIKSLTRERWFRERLAVGYEEGIAFRFRTGMAKSERSRNLLFTSGFNYQYDKAYDQFHRPMQEFHVKLGILQEIAVFSRLRFGIYLEAMEKMKHFEAQPLLMETKYNRFALWATKARSGIQFSIYGVEKFLVTFKFGVEAVYVTPYYVPNSAKTKLVKVGEGTFKISTNTAEVNALETIINSIGIYINF